MLLEVNKDGFTTSLAKNKLVLANFYSPACEECKTLIKMINDNILSEFRDKDVAFLKINASLIDDLAKEYQISETPTLMFFLNGRKMLFEESGKNKDRMIGYTPGIDSMIIEVMNYFLNLKI